MRYRCLDGFPLNCCLQFVVWSPHPFHLSFNCVVVFPMESQNPLRPLFYGPMCRVFRWMLFASWISTDILDVLIELPFQIFCCVPSTFFTCVSRVCRKNREITMAGLRHFEFKMSQAGWRVMSQVNSKFKLDGLNNIFCTKHVHRIEK